jgi:ornithine decarboxylase
MSQLEILSPHCPADVSNTNPLSDSFSTPYNSWAAKPAIHDLISKSPSNRTVGEIATCDTRITDDDVIFPALPPLRNGHSDIQLRNGIMRASRLAIANESDAEKAFFVADLGQVYLQHERWKKCLPEIEPHYGA